MTERRSFNFEVRAEQDEQHGTFITGVPIVYEVDTDIGLFTERIAKGALDKADMRDVRFLVNHNTDMIPLARSRNNNENSTMQLSVADDGMHIRVNLDIENNADAKALYSAVTRGDISGMSFMFTVNGDKWDDLDSEHPTRIITELGRIFEVSAVTFPAYEQTSIEAADRDAALDSAKSVLDSARSRAAEMKDAETTETEHEAANDVAAFERSVTPVSEMTVDELNTRAAYAAEFETDEARAECEAIKAELTARETAAAKEAETRDAVANSETATTIREFKENRTMSNPVEIRKSDEYKAAFLRFLKTSDETECRALLSTNGTNATASLTGYIPVPEFLENEIKTAWEEHQLLGLVKHTYLKGNVRIGFELSAGGAVVHAEGTSAPNEEVITLGVVEIKAESIKKWITVSDEAIEGTTVETLNYLYREIAQRIVEKAEEELIGKITAASTTSTTSAPAVKEVELPAAGLAIDTIVMAVAELSGQAKDLHIAMNRGTKAKLTSLQMGANYAVDVFDGLRDRVVITDKLPSIGDADEGDTVIIIGDFGYGAQANFPNGEEMGIKVDNLSLAEKDLVKLVGRQYVGMAVVAENAFVRIVLPEEDDD